MQTIYLLKDVNGKVFFENRNFACFSEIFEHTCQPYYLPKASLTQNLVLEFLVDPELTEDQITKFLDQCSKIEIVKASFEKVTSENFCHSFNDGCSGYKIVIKREDYTSDKLFKFAVHLLRPLVETSQLTDLFLRPKPEGVDYFQWYRILASSEYFSGCHNTFGYLIREGVYNVKRNRISSYTISNNPSLDVFIKNVENSEFHNCLSAVLASFREGKFGHYSTSMGSVEENLIHHTLTQNNQ